MKKVVLLIIATFLALAIYSVALSAPPVKKDPDADKTYKHIKRGSKEEKEFFEKLHTPPAHEREHKKHQKKNKPDLEIQQEESTENPIAKIRKEKSHGRANLVKDKNKLEHKNIKNPWDYRVSYHLKGDARLTINILDKDSILIRSFVVHPGDVGARGGKNEAVIWDGMNMFGEQSPEGKYIAEMLIEYVDGKNKGKNKIKTFKLIK